jgi:FMN-dependent NADH-azoreductase
MKTILHLISSPRAAASISTKLGRTIVAKLLEQYPDSKVSEVDLTASQVPHLQIEHLTAFFTAEADRTEEDRQAISYSDQAIEQLKSADFIVIDAPMYNFTIHSSLKAWIDQVARAGHTFRYSENGPEGLVVGKKVYLAVASGGVYSSGPYQPYDFVVPYVKAILGFMGMTDVATYRAEGMNVPGLMEQALAKAIAEIEI